MIDSLIDERNIQFFKLYQSFEKLGVFDTTWQKNISKQLQLLNFNISNLIDATESMSDGIISAIGDLTYATEQQTEKISGNISSLDSSVKFGNLLSAINILFFGILPSISNSFSNMENKQEQLDESLIMIKDVYSQIGVDETLYQKVEDYILVKTNNLKFESLLKLIFFLIEGVGVYLMFLMKRRGFFIYLGAQIGFVLIPFIIQGLNMFSVGEMIIVIVFTSGIFTILYAMNLKHLS